MNSSKILLLTSEFPPQPGGIGTHAHQLASELSKKGKEVTVVADIRSSNGIEEEAFDRKQTFKIIRVQRHKRIWKTYIHRIKVAKKLLSKHEIVLASGKFSLWTAGFLRLIRKRRFVAVVHGTELSLPGFWAPRFTRWSLARFDVIISVSHFTQSLLPKLKTVPKVVIPNGFIAPRSLELTHKRKNADVLRLITIGNVTERKGQHNVVGALPLLRKRFSEVEYHIVGLPSERENIIWLAEKLDVIDCLIFHGRVSEEEKWSLLKNSDIFMMLSENTDRGDVEGFGIAILEANALGLPAIGSLGCGIEDAIDSGSSGILVEGKNPDQVEQAVIAVMDDLPAFSSRAKQWSEQFTWSIIIQKYEKALYL